ncbi:MAG: glycosyltransferase [Phycisphaerae bacterium]|nr:glycosyltransferase [Phycisphaerae bacterium]
MNNRPYVSVVVPVFNESENIASTVQAIEEVMSKTGKSFEIVLVNDGSTDDTPARIAAIAAEDERVKPVGYPVNAGRGKALRTGFDASSGEFVASIDADLSYHPSSILDLLAGLEAHPEADFAIGSPYMAGGGTENVPPLRLLISKMGNYVLRGMMPGNFRTFTGIFRCYRGDMVRGLVLCSDSKEIHLEILTKAIALGYKGVEVPATLRGRKKGKSKFRFRKTATHHLMYAMHERPVAIFGLAGLGMLAVSIGLAVYLLVLSASGEPVGNRPLLLLGVFLGLFSAVMVSIGFVSLQNVMLRNEMYKIASQNRRIAQKLESIEKSSKAGADVPADD